MNIDSVGNNAANVALNAAVSGSQDAQSAQNAQAAGAAVLGGEAVTVTTASPTTEELAAARVESDSAAARAQEAQTALQSGAYALECLSGDLQALAVSMGETPTTAAAPAMDTQTAIATCAEIETTGTSSTWAEQGATTEKSYFSIYQLANMLQQVGQEQRDAARELRTAELNTEVASIEAQADKQRYSALLNSALGMATCAVQACIAVYSCADGVKSIKESSNVGASQDLQQAQTSVQTTEAAMKSPEAAAKNTEQLATKAGEENVRAVDDKLNSGKCGEAKQRYETAQGIEQEGKPKIEAAKSSAQAEVERLDGEIKGLTEEIETLKAQNNANSKASTMEELKAKSARRAGLVEQKGVQEGIVADCDKTLGTMEKTTATAKQEYLDAMDAEVSQMKDDYESASTATKLSEDKYVDEYKLTGRSTNKANAADMKSCQAKQKTLGSQRSYMEAKVAQTKAELGVQPSKAELVAVNENMQECQSSLNTSKGYKMANRGNQDQFIQQIVGSFGHSLADMFGQVGQSLATEEQSNQKTAEAQRQETNDLYSQAQNLIDTARELLQSVMQSESQSVERIISA